MMVGLRSVRVTACSHLLFGSYNRPHPTIPCTSTHPSLSQGQPAKYFFPESGFAAGDVPRGCHLAGSTLSGTRWNPTGPDTLHMLVFLHGVILWCSAINYCYTTIINNFLNENDSVDLRCILIIRVKHNYTAALSWHVDSFRAQFCFNTLIM